MTGDAHGYVTGAIALVIALGVVILTAMGRPVPDVLTGSLLVIVGAFFGKSIAPAPPAPREPERPALIVPRRPDGGGDAA